MIKTKNLSKSYKDLKALKPLNMTIEKGDIFGFIGPNGAGKSTTFKILSTIMKPDSGSAWVDGIPLKNGDEIRRRIGYMPDGFGVYENMTVYQYLDFFAAAYYIPGKERKMLIGDILELTDLGFKKEAMVQSLSRGMQQRLGVARVLVHDPKVLILDEPASGLDPRARIEFRELLKELSNMGKTILISSHILAELSEICTRVGILEQGEMIFQGSRSDLSEKLMGKGKIRIRTHLDDIDNAIGWLEKSPFTESVSRDQDLILLSVNQDLEEISDIPNYLIEKNIRLLLFQPAELSLEQAFMNLTEGKLA